MNKRSGSRLKKSFLTFTDIKNPEFFGIITNISKGGFFVESDANLSPGSEISLFIPILNKVYNLKGKVLWTIDSDKNSNILKPYGMGIKIVETPVEFINSIEYLRYQSRWR